jgi:hypothetical protein
MRQNNDMRETRQAGGVTQQKSKNAQRVAASGIMAKLAPAIARVLAWNIISISVLSRQRQAGIVSCLVATALK